MSKKSLLVIGLIASIILIAGCTGPNTGTNSVPVTSSGCPADFLESMKTYFDSAAQSQDESGVYYNIFCLSSGDKVGNYTVDSIATCWGPTLCNSGSSTGQNVNYIYCEAAMSIAKVSIHKINVDTNGNVIGRKDYTLAIDWIGIAPAKWKLPQGAPPLPDMNPEDLKRHVVDIDCRLG